MTEKRTPQNSVSISWIAEEKKSPRQLQNINETADNKKKT
jgi:hypothetical protein